MKLKGEVVKIEDVGDWTNITIGNVRGATDAVWRPYRNSLVLSIVPGTAKRIGMYRKVELNVKFK